MQPIGATLRGLDVRGRLSRRVVVDAEGAMLGPHCVLVRRTPAGYRCTSADEAAAIQSILRNQYEGPDWLFRQCCRIAKALADGHLAVAQIYGLFVRTDPLDDGQVTQLAALAHVVKANFNPDQPRDAYGRWTDLDDVGSNTPASQSSPAARHANPPTPPAYPAASPLDHPTPAVPATTSPGDARPPMTQLAADNRRQNKMVRDIVVQLRLDKDQREELHRAISGQGLNYQEILSLAKEMFNK